MDRNFIIAVDFDGTIVEHRFPRVGPPVPGAIDWLRKFQLEPDVKLVLWTMRCDEGSIPLVLSDAVAYCRCFGIEFWGINENPQQKESGWSTSGKAYAHVYIDDSAAGIPLIYTNHHLPYVDWSIVGPNVMARLEGFRQWERMRANTKPGDLPPATGLAHDEPRVELATPTLIQP